MAKLPGGQKVGFAFVKCSDQGSERSQEGRRSRGKRSRAGGFWGSNDEGKENGRNESNNGKDDEGKGADAADVPKSVFRGGDVGFWMVAEIDFTDPGCRVEEERKPACTYESCSSWRRGLFLTYPCPKLDPADGLYPIR